LSVFLNDRSQIACNQEDAHKKARIVIPGFGILPHEASRLCGSLLYYSGEADSVANNARRLFPDPFNSVAGQLTKRLKVFTAAGVIGQEFDLRTTGQVPSAFFKTKNRERAHQTNGIDLMYLLMWR